MQDSAGIVPQGPDETPSRRSRYVPGSSGPRLRAPRPRRPLVKADRLPPFVSRAEFDRRYEAEVRTVRDRGAAGTRALYRPGTPATRTAYVNGRDTAWRLYGALLRLQRASDRGGPYRWMTTTRGQRGAALGRCDRTVARQLIRLKRMGLIHAWHEKRSGVHRLGGQLDCVGFTITRKALSNVDVTSTHPRVDDKAAPRAATCPVTNVKNGENDLAPPEQARAMPAPPAVNSNSSTEKGGAETDPGPDTPPTELDALVSELKFALLMASRPTFDTPERRRTIAVLRRRLTVLDPTHPLAEGTPP